VTGLWRGRWSGGSPGRKMRFCRRPAQPIWDHRGGIGPDVGIASVRRIAEMRFIAAAERKEEADVCDRGEVSAALR